MSTKKQSVEELEVIATISGLFRKIEYMQSSFDKHHELIKNQILEAFSSNILYWVDGYKDIFEEANLTEEQKTFLYGRIMEHQRHHIETVAKHLHVIRKTSFEHA